MEENNKVLEKLRKLMLKQQSAEEMGNSEEAFVFAQGIQKILNEYNLSISDVDTSDRSSRLKKEGGIDGSSKGFKGKSGYHIMFVIAKYNWCRAYSSGDSKNPRITIIGSPENVEVCKYLYLVIMNAADFIGKKAYRAYLKSLNAEALESVFGIEKPSRGKYMRSFILGFKSGLEAKFKAERDSFKRESEKSGALIVANDAMLAEFEKACFPKMGTFKTKFSNVGDSVAKGREAGANLEIHKGLKATSKPEDILSLSDGKHKCCNCKQEKAASLMEKVNDKWACCCKWVRRTKTINSY